MATAGDIAFDEGRQMWSYSKGGAGPLIALREADGQSSIYPELSEAQLQYVVDSIVAYYRG